MQSQFCNANKTDFESKQIRKLNIAINIAINIACNSMTMVKPLSNFSVGSFVAVGKGHSPNNWILFCVVTIKRVQISKKHNNNNNNNNKKPTFV